MPAAVSGTRVDIVYTNDATINGIDRNARVASITVDGTTLEAGSASYDAGSGNAAFDGVDVRPGQANMFWNGALRFVVGGSGTSPAAPAGRQRLLRRRHQRQRRQRRQLVERAVEVAVQARRRAAGRPVRACTCAAARPARAARADELAAGRRLDRRRLRQRVRDVQGRGLRCHRAERRLDPLGQRLVALGSGRHAADRPADGRRPGLPRRAVAELCRRRDRVRHHGRGLAELALDDAAVVGRPCRRRLQPAGRGDGLAAQPALAGRERHRLELLVCRRAHRLRDVDGEHAAAGHRLHPVEPAVDAGHGRRVLPRHGQQHDPRHRRDARAAVEPGTRSPSTAPCASTVVRITGRPDLVVRDIEATMSTAERHWSSTTPPVSAWSACARRATAAAASPRRSSTRRSPAPRAARSPTPTSTRTGCSASTAGTSRGSTSSTPWPRTPGWRATPRTRSPASPSAPAGRSSAAR
ncbi:MAG: hypothetical protein MZW92_47530 [Comamonadaceae bacterium]|nr:hypothetical protein [Comamonadaceae bacterium]